MVVFDNTIRERKLVPKRFDLDALYTEMEKRFYETFVVISPLERSHGNSARISISNFGNVYHITLFPYQQVQINYGPLEKPEHEQEDLDEIQGVLSEIFEQ